MKKVFIIGISGKMGNMICECVKDFDGLEISGGLDSVPHPLYPTFAKASEVNVPVDVIIDFSRPETLDDIIFLVEKFGCGAVIATTGYDESQLKKINCLSEKHAVLRSGNMSLGVNLLTELVKKAAAALGENFDIEIVEKHHNQKVDAPSGTALMLADSAAEAGCASRDYVQGRTGKNCKRNKGDIGISSVRGGTVVGEHEVMFCGNDEVITLSHSALSRKIFAVGALKAARFLTEKKSGLYDMKDVLQIN